MHKVSVHIIFYIVVYCIGIHSEVYGQTFGFNSKKIKLDNNEELIVVSETKDSMKFCQIIHGDCKDITNQRFITIAKSSLQYDKAFSTLFNIKPNSINILSKTTSLFKANGNVNYEYYYNQMIDTPFNSSYFKQHTVSANINLLYKNKYPFHLNFTARSTNNIYFKDFINVGGLFDIHQFQEIQKNEYLNKLRKYSAELNAISTNKKTITNLEKQIVNTENEINNPAVLQKIIHERELALNASFKSSNNNSKGKDLKSDSLNHNADSSIGLSKSIDSVKKEEHQFNLKNLKGIFKSRINTDTIARKDAFGNKLNNQDSDSSNKLNNVDSSKLTSAKVDTSYRLPKDSSVHIKVIYRHTDSITLFSKYINKDSSTLQRTPTEMWYEQEKQKLARLDSQILTLTKYNDSLKKVYDEEELSVNQHYNDKDTWKKHTEKYGNVGEKNIGLNFLKNIKSVGIGQMNVNYSLLTIRNTSLTGLSLEYEPQKYYAIAAGRVDYRYRDFFVGNTIPAQEFFIMRVGTNTKKKQGIILSGFSGRKNLFVNNNTSQNYFTGYSIVAFYKFTKDNYIEYEIAKTTCPKIPNNLPNAKPTVGLFSINSDINLATAIKVHLIVPFTSTKLDGNYQKIGENFQSINIYTNGVSQQAWSIKAEQSFCKKMVTMSAMVRKNDFEATGYAINYNTNTVFKSFLLSFHKRKWPFFSLGYFPGNQLVKSDSGKIIQNMYYMYNATGGYSTILKKYVYTTVLNYNEFINQSTDTGFTYFNGRTIQFTQNYSSSKYNFDQSIAYTKQQILQFYSFELGAGILYKWYGVNVAKKYNKVISGNEYWGNRLNISVRLKKLGVVQCIYDQQFIPGKDKTLMKADMGRISYTKYF